MIIVAKISMVIVKERSIISKTVVIALIVPRRYSDIDVIVCDSDFYDLWCE